MGFDSKAKDRSLEATWIERSGSAAEAAKPRPRRRGALTKRVLRNARDRVEEEEDEVVMMRRMREMRGRVVMKDKRIGI